MNATLPGFARKAMLTLLIVGVAGTTMGLGVFSAFSGKTDNQDNRFQTGTVAVKDNDLATTSLYSELNAKPGDPVPARCITITYDGTITPSEMKLYRGTLANTTIGDGLHLTVTRGSFTAAPPANLDCTGFTADGSPAAFDGTLNAMGADYASGTALADPDTNGWVKNETATYKFELSFPSTAGDDTYQGLDTGLHAFTWEAKS